MASDKLGVAFFMVMLVIGMVLSYGAGYDAGSWDEMFTQHKRCMEIIRGNR